MFTLIKTWLVTVIAWPVIVWSFEKLQKSFQLKSPEQKNDYTHKMGWTLIGAGSFGLMVGISGCSSKAEVVIRLVLALTAGVLGYILTSLTTGDSK